MNILKEFRTEVDKKKGQLAYIQKSMDKLDEEYKVIKKKKIRTEMALAIFREVSQMTQEQIETHLSNLVSLSMEAVFQDPYGLSLEFVQRRGKTECDVMFVKGDNKVDPLSSSGYGPVDIAAFALRIAAWFISGKKSRNTFILDEPFKHLKGIEENRKAINMVKKISETLGIQIIMISDERASREDIMEGADKVFEVSQKKGRSMVNELG